MSDDGGHKILFQLTGSIACFKACELLSRLAKRGIAVQTVASAGALRFVGASQSTGRTHRATQNQRKVPPLIERKSSLASGNSRPKPLPFE